MPICPAIMAVPAGMSRLPLSVIVAEQALMARCLVVLASRVRETVMNRMSKQ